MSTFFSATVKEAVADVQTSKEVKTAEACVVTTDLEQSKAAVLNSLTSRNGQRSYERAINDFVEWYCSEPRLSLNRTVVLRYRIYLEQKPYAPTTINLRLAAIRRVAYEAADSGLLRRFSAQAAEHSIRVLQVSGRVKYWRGLQPWSCKCPHRFDNFAAAGVYAPTAMPVSAFGGCAEPA